MPPYPDDGEDYFLVQTEDPATISWMEVHEAADEYGSLICPYAQSLTSDVYGLSGVATQIYVREDMTSVFRRINKNATALYPPLKGKYIVYDTLLDVYRYDDIANIYPTYYQPPEPWVPLKSEDTTRPLLRPQSGTADEKGENVAQDDIPEQQTSDMMMNYQVSGNLNLVYTGESISSFRTLLKRFNRWLSFGHQIQHPVQIFRQLTLYPFYRGAFDNGVHNSQRGSYNYCNTTMALGYIMF